MIAAADSRPWLHRLIGRAPVVSDPGEAAASEGVPDPAPAIPGSNMPTSGEAVAAERIAAGHLDRHSVWLQSSIRGAAGLAAAVLIARLSGNQEGFWIVLGALSALRSNALSTGATALRALGGTVLGFAIGGLLVAAIGTSPAVLWPLLPVAILVAAFAPEAIGFAAGQAAFTVVVIILFNIITPAGWRLGVLRVEDVALGCAASLAAGVLFWPRGAAPALGTALADAYRTGAEYLRQAIDYATGRRDATPDMHATVEAAGWRLDDALRQYLAERGAKHVSLEEVTALANGASRLRLAATAVKKLRPPAPVGDEALAAPIGQLVDRTAQITGWYATLADTLAGRASAVPPPGAPPRGDSFLDVVLPAVDRCHRPERAEHAERLLWSGQYLGDVDQVRAELVEPAGVVSAARLRPWWTR